MKAKVITVLLFSLSLFSLAQENHSTTIPKGDWTVSLFAGFATIESDDVFKSTATVSGGTIGKEFVLNETFTMHTGLSNFRFRADAPLSDEEIYFFRLNVLQLPVDIRIQTNFSEKTTAFAQGGIYGSYLYCSRIENEMQDVDHKESGLGFNFGLGFNTGVKHQLNEQFSLNLGLLLQSDLFESSTDNQASYKATDLYAFQFGAGIKL